MKVSNVSAALLLLLVSVNVSAAREKTGAMNGTVAYDENTIKQAMVILLRSGAIVLDPSNGARVDQGLIEDLRNDGTIEPSMMKASTICWDTGG